jgi:Transposase DDE domain.
MRAEERVSSTIQTIRGDGFLRMIRDSNTTAFTRKRKVTAEWITFGILNSRGLTQKMELRKYQQMTGKKTEISQWGYTKARLKIHPKVFDWLNQEYLHMYYCEDNEQLQTFKGYIPTAIDGSDIHLPSSPETQSKYGDSNAWSDYPVVMGSASCAYDVINHMILDACLNKYKHCERDSARTHIRNIGERYPQEHIYIFDRGYPSAEFLMELIDQELYFLFRLGGKTFQREQKALSSEDEWIDICFDQTRMNPYRGTSLYEKMAERGKLHLRMVRIELAEGVQQVLLTNLPDDTFPLEDLKTLYHLRWDIETVYNTLKSKMQLENFSGKLPQIIEQDFFVTIYLYNLISDIQQQSLLDAEKKKTKHEMKPNENMAIGIVKDNLVRMALEEDGNKRAEIFSGIIEEIKRYRVPIRPERNYKRTTAVRKTKYSQYYKSSY